MKKIIAGVALMLITSVSYAQSFTCTGWTDGKLITTIKVNADKVAVAETKAASRMKKDKLVIDYVKCE